MAARWSVRSTTRSRASYRPRASRSIRGGVRSSSSIRAPGMGRASAEFKADSEIGVAFKAGHPCYFVGFLPDPVPGQTLEDIARAEAVFIEKVIALHPEAEAKPCVIGNCQAGWAVMMLAAMRPELFGPIIIAGSPLSYWGGVHGKYPMRYSGGLLGGSWLTALTSDLGRGKFDGAWLVQNFENQKSRQYAVDQAVQPVRRYRHRGPALSRLRTLVGRARQPQRRGNPGHCRQPVHWQQARGGNDQGFGRHDDRPAQHPLADRGVLLEGRQCHAAAAGIGLDPRSLR